MQQSPQLLIIACGAIAREVSAVARINGWKNIKVSQIPAALHNRPEQIPAAVEQRLQDYAGEYDHVFVGFADCGTGGRLDKVIEQYQVQRLSGAHCYEFYAGSEAFARLAEAELGTFYLTDYLAKHFESLVMQGMGLRDKPKLMPLIFGHYKKLVYMAQDETRQLDHFAEAAAKDLGLSYEKIVTGYGQLSSELGQFMHHYETKVIKWQH
ncbi:MAG: DUF1638 domain-containing protein [Gammaproteobacteria bacterium]|jgi:hypothetical protein|nr:DUF1638 domain-containing protein [Gammaproteobacteria bacterium]MCP4880655.1 DUF1638 domain-containing protein [Gammaproteobacteria bacterium]MDP6165498.1 DUF1638 domain-containing protein [Gammaproteobacteria bacterium]